MALIIVLSVFNGFEQLVISLYNSFNPQILIVVNEGKTFDISKFPVDEIKKIPGIVYFTEVVEENVLLQNNQRQHIATMKGVSSSFIEMSNLDSCIIEGRFFLPSNNNTEIIVGSGVAYFLNLDLSNAAKSLQLFVPRNTPGTSFNFEQAFNRENVFPTGVFTVQSEIDAKYIILDLNKALELLEYKNERTAIELGINENISVDKIQEQLNDILGSGYIVKNRFQQQELLYRIMKSEKLAIFLILAFILVIASFNVIGSLTMLILDKRKDIAILQSMGAENRLIKRIFLYEGIMISLIGAIGGLILGSAVCYIQQQFGLVKLGDDDGSFIINSYPVIMRLTDFIIIFFTVLSIGFGAALIPVMQISKRYLQIKIN